MHSKFGLIQTQEAVQALVKSPFLMFGPATENGSPHSPQVSQSKAGPTALNSFSQHMHVTTAPTLDNQYQECQLSGRMEGKQ